MVDIPFSVRFTTSQAQKDLVSVPFPQIALFSDTRVNFTE
jgi:hypothetical protein